MYDFCHLNVFIRLKKKKHSSLNKQIKEIFSFRKIVSLHFTPNNTS